jgi:hypothetical protein
MLTQNGNSDDFNPQELTLFLTLTLTLTINFIIAGDQKQIKLRKDNQKQIKLRKDNQNQVRLRNGDVCQFKV